MATLGERIVALRTALGWSQPELARRINISQPALSNIESGKTKKLRGDTLAGLCRALNVSPESLLGSKRSSSQEAVLHEAEMLALWRSMGESDQAHLLAIARALARKPAAQTPTDQPKRQRRTNKPATTDHGQLDEI